MVKNAGGKKSKKVARKNVGGGGGGTQDVRKAADASEMYAAVIKIYSSQRCSVLGADGNTYQCTIRGKFLKNKRSGEGLVNGAWILIGFYEWEVRSDGSKKCDLLEIYSHLEKDKLKQLETRHLAELMKIEGSDGANCTFSSFHIGEEGSSDDESDGTSAAGAASAPAALGAAAPAVSLYALMKKEPSKKETAQEQMDWLVISDKDI
jgi:hypothetical protein